MNRNERASVPPGEPIARLAVAQFLLLEAAVESLSVLGERLAGASPDAGGVSTREAMLGPFRARYALLRQVIGRPTRHRGARAPGIRFPAP
jgi:hypothetical protein